MKKRIISLVLVGVLTLSILGGCGKKEIPLEESTTESTDELIAEEGAQLKFWVGGGKLEYGGIWCSSGGRRSWNGHCKQDDTGWTKRKWSRCVYGIS